MVTGGEAKRLRLLLPLHFLPHQKATLKAEVKEVGVGKRQRLFCRQCLQSRPPPVQHGGASCGLGVSRTPEYLRSQNLKPTEVQRSILKGRRAEQVSNPGSGL